jgi:thiol-disulfide isomerase/thioredoxin
MAIFRRFPHPGLGLLALALSPLVLAACGGNGSPPASEPRASDPAALAKGRDLPRPLAANLEQANELIDGGEEALEAKLAELEGHPVVVNQWGSWCAPCREEFPFFAESAEAHLDEVAFLGVDIQDDRAAAEEFLAELPVPYPSVFDQDTAAVASLGWPGTSPTTWLIDERGEIVFQRPGAYANREQLEADIDRYLLRG